MKDYDQAIKHYLKALKVDPQDIDAWYNMGLAYDKKKDLDHAIECYQERLRPCYRVLSESCGG
ncbi:MAG: tetratricopeptide repeat protein [Promethearchaeota archaeon]